MTTTIARALANAIAHAVGVRIKELPLTAEGILESLKQKKEGKDVGSREEDASS